MGSTNHGIQNQTYNFYEEASGKEFNKRNVDIRPRGIYKGGYLTEVSDSVITLSPFTVEIGDDDVQVCVKTAAVATINNTTLDSGTISSATPYIILRWAYVESSANYLEVHAVNQTAIDVIALTNDIVVGKCNFSGATLVDFDYTDRTFLSIQDLFLKVETSSGLYVQLRNGRIHTSSGYVTIPETKVGPFSVPGAPNSRIDLLYIASDGTPTILEGSAGVSPTAPSYAGKLVVAEITIVNGDISIPADQIVDSRSFTTPFIDIDTIPDGSNLIGTGVSKSTDTVYTAATSGSLVVRCMVTWIYNTDTYAIIYSDTSATPTTIVGKLGGRCQRGDSAQNILYFTASIPIVKGKKYRVVPTASGITVDAITFYPNQ